LGVWLLRDIQITSTYLKFRITLKEADIFDFEHSDAPVVRREFESPSSKPTIRASQRNPFLGLFLDEDV
jgi:hypothetical protein